MDLPVNLQWRLMLAEARAERRMVKDLLDRKVPRDEMTSEQQTAVTLYFLHQQRVEQRRCPAHWLRVPQCP
jgi:hypothetical protein